MTSADYQDRSILLHAALDNELDAAGAIEVERMLAADQELAAEYARLEALRKTIRAHAPREKAPESLRARVMAAVEETDAAHRETVARSWRNPPSWRVFGGSIAATVALTIGLQSLISSVGAPDSLTPSIVAGHMRSQISGRPVDVISSDRHTVKPWLAGKLPVAAVVVDLANEGFPLLGGRIDIVANAAVPTLVYKRREHLVSVTQLRADGSNYPATPSCRVFDGYSVVVWSDGEHAYATVSDLAPNELDAFVAAFRKAATEGRADAGAAGTEK